MTPERMRLLAARLEKLAHALSTTLDRITVMEVVHELRAEADRIDVDMPIRPFADTGL